MWGLRHDPPVPGRGGGPPADHHLCDGGGQLRRLPPQCGSPAPVLELLKLCGLTERPTRVILGGPLTGTATEDLRNEKVELSTTAVLAIRDDKHEYSYTCIGCGRCTAVCPQGLNPMRILQELRRGNRRAVEELGIEDCTQCTCCSYICPSRQSVAGEILLYRQKGGEEP